MKGIAVIAIGTTAYGEWAVNLARSLRQYCSLPIQLIYGDSAIKPEQFAEFDVLTKIKPEDSHPGGRLNPSFCKLRMYEYLHEGWEQIMYLDVDALCIKDPTPLFDFPHPFGIQVTGVSDKESGVDHNMLWMELSRFRSIFGVSGRVPGANSSMILVRRSDEAEQVFSDAQRHYWNYIKEHNSTDLHMRWGRKKDGSGILPDELFFNAALTGKDNYSLGTPIKFHTRKIKWEGAEAYKKDHFFIGYWGNSGHNNLATQKEYNSIVSQFGGAPKINNLLRSKFVNIN